MEKLDRIESVYQRKDGKAKLYDGTIVDCTVYTRDGKERGPDIDKPPQERYLQIMSEGARHHGVNLAHIEFLEKHECVPRVKPEEFKKFEDPPAGAPTYNAEELAKFNGLDGNPLYTTINGKVRQYVNEDPKGYEDQVARIGRIGQHGDLFMSRMLYDPKYGNPNTVHDFTREHAAYVEDAMYRFQEAGNSTLHHYKTVAYFDQKYKDWNQERAKPSWIF